MKNIKDQIDNKCPKVSDSISRLIFKRAYTVIFMFVEKIIYTIIK